MADSKCVMKSLLKNNILCIGSKSKELVQAGLENSAKKTEQNASIEGAVWSLFLFE